MKPNQTVPLIFGSIALIATIGFGLEFENNMNANGLATAIGSTLLPFAGLVISAYFFWKGGRNV